MLDASGRFQSEDILKKSATKRASLIKSLSSEDRIENQTPQQVGRGVILEFRIFKKCDILKFLIIESRDVSNLFELHR